MYGGILTCSIGTKGNNSMERQVALWPANSLPVPFGVLTEETKEYQPEPQVHAEVDMNDNFPKGVVVKYFPNQKFGFLKDRTGRDVYFNLLEMDFVGQKGKESLRDGLTVGYDIVHSGKELHIKKMKIY